MKIIFLLYYSIVQTAITYGKNPYLGCFIDQIGDRDLNIFISDYEQLTPQQCIAACREQNILYAGIQFGNECRCGQHYGKYGQVSDDECTYNCSTSEKCGGDNRNSIYNVFKSIDTTKIDSSCQNNLIGYQGCFDSITLKKGVGVVHSLKECIQRCAIKYDYAGIMNGYLCYCDNHLTRLSSKSNLCNIPCHRSPTDCCGGLYVLSVYNIESYQSSSSINDLSEKLIRVKRAAANSETTYTSAQTTEASSMSSESVTTSSLVNSPTTNNPSATSSRNDLSSMMSSVTSTNSLGLASTSASVVLSTIVSSTDTVSLSLTLTTEPISGSTMSITTGSSAYSSQSTMMTATQQNSPNTSLSFTNSLASSSTNIGIQTTVNSSLPTAVTTQTTSSTTSTGTTVSTTATTNVSASYTISTIIIVPLTQNFTPTDNNTRESVRRGLVRMINLAFTCIANPSNTNCTRTSQRRKRDVCSSGYDVNLLSDFTDVSTSSASRKYEVHYAVVSLCSGGGLVSPIQVKTATDVLSSAQIITALGYNYEGTLIRSTVIGNTQTAGADPKLWIIGAVLGPVGFVLLLIFVFCYLHYKCRPRPANRQLTKNISKAPPVSARSTNYKTMTNEPTQEKSTSEKSIHALTNINPLVGTTATPRRLTPTESEKSSHSTPRYPVSVEMPMDEIRRQNDVERWRNKLRLQEKFQPSSSIQLPGSSVSTIKETNRSDSSQYDNQAFQNDIPIINIQPAEEIISNNSPRRLPPDADIEVGRTKLHRLLDEVPDKADSEESYNPDSEGERQKRRRQRRRMNSISDDRKPLPIDNKHQQIPHVPIIPQVSERPDRSIIRLHYNPYEAGDRAHDLANLPPVEFKRKYSIDEPQNNQQSSRSNPPLFFDDFTIADRATTATDAYASSKRVAKSRVETDREAAMRHNGGRMDQRQHQFNDEEEEEGDPMGMNDYRNEFRTAKKSAVNTQHIISSIHDELQHMTMPSSKDYHA
ncbi:unnamed protein product [Rotaria magnacalcarata]|uniref:WSC domain-containing protein n=14 Tax=Rotaria magnacalcarata TaxID=392030 RepID=A0A814EZW6_9BILA|nr:unnamed protein product [Rotaria magnacalcarata]